MSTHQFFLHCVVVLLAVTALTAAAPAGLLDDLTDEAEDRVEDVIGGDDSQTDESENGDSDSEGEPDEEDALVATHMVFSSSPIAPAGPEDLTTSFTAGDPIYALVQLDETFQHLAEPDADEPPARVMVEVKTYVDGSYEATFNIALRDDAAAGQTLALDIAPEPENLTAFDDPNVEVGKTFDVYDGPIQFTKTLMELTPGQHTIRVEVYHYAVWAQADFVIKGEDYAVYGELRDSLLEEITRSFTMPEPQMVDADLEAEMLEALKSAEAEVWQNDILRIVIIDADWYVEHYDDTEIILRRYIRANVAIKDADGVCWVYDLVTFEQVHDLEEYGPTTFSGVGDRKKILEENIFPEGSE